VSIYGGRPLGARFPSQAPTSPAGSRTGGWRLRNWRLRTRLIVLLVIPLVLAGVLGGFRIAGSVGDIQDLSVVEREVALGEQVAMVIDALQTERHLAAAAAATDALEQQALVEAQIQQVDIDVAAMRDVEADPSALDESSSAAYQDVLRRLDSLAGIREEVFAPDTSVEGAIGRYSEVIATLTRFSRIVLAGTGSESASLATGIPFLAEAKEQLSVQHAVLLAATLDNQATAAQTSELRSADASFDVAVRNFSESVPSAERQIYFSTVTNDALIARERLLSIGLGEWPIFIPLESITTEWDEAATTLRGMLRVVEASLSDDLQAAIAAAREAAVTDTVRDAAIVVALLLLTLILLVLVARSILRPLLALRTGALDVAQRRLPALVEQLRRPGGWKDDVRAEPMALNTSEDIGQVARAFDEVHREAVRLATEQAMMRSTVNDMFVNLSRRSQSMVERQLRIIDALESGERDPEALGELFRLDHLATRMRRNNENLLVLAGSETRQRSGAARPALDILRAAISEIEEYQRISIESVPDTAVLGVAVNDLVHLTAELLDNATNFSPKEAQVVLASSLRPDGTLLIEIRDTGVGMSTTQRNAINDRLAVPPMVDVSVSRHMGLFVVGRLAARHGIAVRMQVTGAQGGLTAAVSVPSWLISAEVERPGPVARPADVGGNASMISLGTGSMFETASSASMARPGSGATLDAAGNGGMVPAGVGTNLNGAGNGELFDAAVTQTLDFSARTAPPRSEPAADLFAPTVPTVHQSADFFAGLPPADSSTQGQSEGTPIFQEMRSAWFRQKPRVPGAGNATDRAGDDSFDSGDPASTDWNTSATADFGSWADEGWEAAEQLRTPVDAGITAAGLPRRRPRAHLVPGVTARRVAETNAAPAGRMNTATLLRDAERVRGNLSSYQRGSRRGRHSSPTEDSERSSGDPTPAASRSARRTTLREPQ